MQVMVPLMMLHGAPPSLLPFPPSLPARLFKLTFRFRRREKSLRLLQELARLLGLAAGQRRGRDVDAALGFVPVHFHCSGTEANWTRSK